MPAEYQPLTTPRRSWLFQTDPLRGAEIPSPAAPNLVSCACLARRRTEKGGPMRPHPRPPPSAYARACCVAAFAAALAALAAGAPSSARGELALFASADGRAGPQPPVPLFGLTAAGTWTA